MAKRPRSRSRGLLPRFWRAVITIARWTWQHPQPAIAAALLLASAASLWSFVRQSDAFVIASVQAPPNVELALPKRRRLVCSGCGERVGAGYDRRVVTWRHLDVFRVRCVLRCEIRRVCCPACGIRGEQVAWARAGSRFTRAFEDTCVWLARSAPKSRVAELLSVDWASVGRMIERVSNGSSPSTPAPGTVTASTACGGSGSTRSPPARATGTSCASSTTIQAGLCGRHREDHSRPPNNSSTPSDPSGANGSRRSQQIFTAGGCSRSAPTARTRRCAPTPST